MSILNILKNAKEKNSEETIEALKKALENETSLELVSDHTLFIHNLSNTLKNTFSKISKVNPKSSTLHQNNAIEPKKTVLLPEIKTENEVSKSIPAKSTKESKNTPDEPNRKSPSQS